MSIATFFAFICLLVRLATQANRSRPKPTKTNNFVLIIIVIVVVFKGTLSNSKISKIKIGYQIDRLDDAVTTASTASFIHQRLQSYPIWKAIWTWTSLFSLSVAFSLFVHQGGIRDQTNNRHFGRTRSKLRNKHGRSIGAVQRSTNPFLLLLLDDVGLFFFVGVCPYSLFLAHTQKGTCLTTAFCRGIISQPQCMRNHYTASLQRVYLLTAMHAEFCTASFAAVLYRNRITCGIVFQPHRKRFYLTTAVYAESPLNRIAAVFISQPHLCGII